jgi:hypothetical protein
MDSASSRRTVRALICPAGKSSAARYEFFADIRPAATLVEIEVDAIIAESR